MLWIKNYISDSLIILGVFWLLIEIIDFFFPGNLIYIKDIEVFIYIILIVLLISLFRNYPDRKFIIKISGVDSKITIIVGDLIKKDADIVFASSNYFNTDPSIISEKSLLGQFIMKKDINLKEIDIQISESLNNRKTNASPIQGKTISYPIGSVAIFSHLNKNIFLLAITKIINKRKKEIAYSEHSFVLKALTNLWDIARFRLDNRELHMPLIGTGIGKSFQQSLEAIIFICIEFIKETKKRKICNGMKIYLQKGSFSLSELEQIKMIIKNLAN